MAFRLRKSAAGYRRGDLRLPRWTFVALLTHRRLEAAKRAADARAEAPQSLIRS